MLYNTNVKKERQKSAKQLYPFPFDHSKKEMEASEKEIEERLERIKQEPQTLEEYKKFITTKKKNDKDAIAS